MNDNNINTGLGNKVIKSLFWKFLERISAQAVSTIVSIILARILMPEDYGVITVVLIFINICNVFVSEGFGSGLIQKKDADQLDFSSMFYLSLIFSILIYIVLFFTAPYISIFFGSGYTMLTPVLRVMALRIPIASFNSIQQAYVSRHLQFKKFFIATLFGTIVSAIVGIIMAYKGMGVWSLVGQYLTNTVIDTIVLAFCVRWHPSLKFSLKRSMKIMRFSSKILVAGLIDTLYSELRSFAIGKKYTSSDLAYYNKGKQFPDLIINNINSSLMAVLFPVMSKFQDSVDRIRQMCKKTIKISTYILFPSLLGLAAIANEFVYVVLTEKWAPIVPFVMIFCFIYSLYPIYTVNLQAIKAIGNSRAFLIVELSKKVVGVILLFVFLPYGPLWVAISLMVSTILNYVINGISAKVVLKYSFKEQIADIAPNLVISVIMFILVFFMNNPFSSMLLNMLFKIVLGAFIYLSLSFISKNESLFFLINKLEKYNKPKIIKAQLDTAFTACRDYLKSGKYKTNQQFNIIYKQDVNFDFISTFEQKNKTKRISKVFSSLYSHSLVNENCSFGGEIVIISTNRSQYKIINLESSQILTIYKSSIIADEIVRNRTLISRIYILPPLIQFRENMTIEQYVPRDSISHEELYSMLLKHQLKSINNIKATISDTNSYFDSFELPKFEFYSETDKLFDFLNRCPQTITHGDIWSSNLIFCSSKLFVIDYENVSIRPFVIDVFYYIFAESFINHNFNIVSEYFNGVYDDYLLQIFHEFGHDFLRHNKLFYLECTILILWNERWKKMGGPSNEEIKRYLVKVKERMPND